MDILSFILGYIKGKSQGGGGNADEALDEVDTYLDSINGGSVHLVTFAGEDGKTICNVTVPDGEDCPDPIATGLMSKPTKPDTLSFRHSFAGWSFYKGGAADENALKNITKNKTLYVAFSTVRIMGSCGETANWTISDDFTTIHIKGYGEVKRVAEEWWIDHQATVKNVTFSNVNGNITSLGDRLFAMSVLENVIIPKTVTEIGAGTFGACPNLKTITIPSSVTSIGIQAFQWSGLESATFEITTGWVAHSEPTDTNLFPDTNISSAQLSQPSKAAEYLVETYVDCEWTRS